MFYGVLDSNKIDAEKKQKIKYNIIMEMDEVDY